MRVALVGACPAGLLVGSALPPAATRSSRWTAMPARRHRAVGHGAG